MKMRIIHRYLGFFLAGIMAVYAISGIVLIFRDSDTFKREITTVSNIPAQLDSNALGKELNIKKFKVVKTEGEIIYFKDGFYNKSSGEASVTKKELPYILDQMTHLHKAKSNQPLFFLNIFFGLGLLFFVLSSFWMFMPKSNIFKKGLIYTAAGVVLTLLLLFV
jgi:hypothetical protein